VTLFKKVKRDRQKTYIYIYIHTCIYKKDGVMSVGVPCQASCIYSLLALEHNRELALELLGLAEHYLVERVLRRIRVLIHMQLYSCM
jgi:hypothetical protein